jgi:NADPH:quinone reductase-like Zn-dependent oxidoreductase
VQLAKVFGAQVAGVCSTPKMELVKSIGADQVIDYTIEDFTERGETYDVIFDTVGMTSVSKSIRSLKNDGTYLFATFGLPKLIGITWSSMTSRKKTVIGLLEPKAKDLIFLTELIESGKMKPVIDRCYPIEQAVEAHRYVEQGRKKGNVILVFEPSRT